MMGFFTAPRICLGPGSIEQLSALGARKTLLVVDPTVAEHNGHRRIREELLKEGGEVEVTSRIRIGPTLESLADAAARATEFGPDWIVGVGGGSTLDSAKGIWLQYARPDLDPAQLTPLSELRLRDRARFVGIPTTSGSGSEVSWTAQFWNAQHRPVELASREFVPDWALLDPTLPATMPPSVAVDSGLDALAHGLEALASSWATPLSDGLAREAVTVLASRLPDVLEHPDDLELRGRVHAAATMAGMAASNAQTGLAHAMAHALGARSGLPHGRLVGILLPHILEFNFPAARDVYSSLAPTVGPATVQRGATFADWFRRLNERLGVPPTLAAAGVDVGGLQRSAADWTADVRGSTSFGANPRLPSPQELTALWERAAG